MKLRWIRIIFFSIVMLLITLSIYIIYGQEGQHTIVTDIRNKENMIIKDISIGIVGFDNINTILSTNQDTQYIGKLIYNSILTITEDFKLECDLAKEYNKLNNNTYLIKLKDSILWHDGENFTAQDVKFTIENLKEISSSIYNKNVENIETIEVIDNYTIKIYLKENIENFEYLLCFPILAKHAYEEHTLISKTNIPIGTNNYKIENINEKNIILKNKENKEVKIVLCQTVTELYNAFNKKKIDVIYTNNINYEDYIGKIGYEVNTCIGQQYGYIVINTEKVNSKVRQHINNKIDRTNIIYEIYNNKYIKAYFPLNYKNYLYNDERLMYEYYNDNYSTQELKLLVDKNNEKLCLVADKVREQLKEANINIKVIILSNTDIEYYIKIKEYDMILIEEKTLIDANLKKYLGENNISNYYNEEITNLLNEIKNIKDEKLLDEKYKEILTIYSKDLPFIGLYFNSNFILYNDNLRGNFNHNWFDLFYNIDNWYKVEEEK